jgi:hypothetical protein
MQNTREGEGGGGGDDEEDRCPSDTEEDGRRTSAGSAFSFEHVEICPLESQCNPELNGTFDKAAVLARIAGLSAPELARVSELCLCRTGCKYRKCVDSDPAWWPHCAAAWYEPGMVRDCRNTSGRGARVTTAAPELSPPRQHPTSRGRRMSA